MGTKEQVVQSNVIPFNDRQVIYNVSGQEVKLTPNMIRQYLVTGNRDLVTDQEIVYFMHICKSRGLNPFNKDCYLIKYTQAEGAAIIVSIEKLRMVARQSDDCVGWEKGVIVKQANGELRYSKGLVLDGETLLGGYFKAKPKGWEVPFEIEVNIKGYIKKTRDGSVTRFWSPDNQPTMIAKVAEAQGLRTLWPEKTQGLYVTEEINNENHPIDVDFTLIKNGNDYEGEISKFDSLVPIPDQAFDHFVKVTAEGNKMTVEAFKAKVVAEGRFEDLWKAYEQQTAGKAPAASAPPAAGGPEQAPWARELWIKLRGAGYGDYVTSHLEAFRGAPEKVLLEAKGKWFNIYKGEKPWPLDAPKPAEAAQQAPPVLTDKPLTQPATQPQGQQDDPMAAEFDYLLSSVMLKAKLADGKIVMEAQRALGYPVGLDHISAYSIDALREITEQIQVVEKSMPN